MVPPFLFPFDTTTYACISDHNLGYYQNEILYTTTWRARQSRTDCHKRRRIDPPRAPVANELIAIRIRDGNGEEIQYKVKHTTKMGKVFKAYSEFKRISLSVLRFRLDGNPVKEDDTAQYLELEDGDLIDAMLEQCGC